MGVVGYASPVSAVDWLCPTSFYRVSNWRQTAQINIQFKSRSSSPW